VSDRGPIEVSFSAIKEKGLRAAVKEGVQNLISGSDLPIQEIRGGRDVKTSLAKAEKDSFDSGGGGGNKGIEGMLVRTANEEGGFKSELKISMQPPLQKKISLTSSCGKVGGNSGF